MERNIKVEAITLKKIALGESNVGVTLLTERDEIIFVMCFGGAKSKNRFFPGITPFVKGVWDLYFDPVKEQWRGKDLNVITFNGELPVRLESFFTASLFCEIVLKCQGTQGIYPLIDESLTILQKSDRHRGVIIQFILRLLNDQGLLPPFDSCSHCGRELNREFLYYSGGDEFLCSHCFRGRKQYEINPGVVKYCSTTPTMEFETAIKVQLEPQAEGHLMKLLIELIKNYTNGKLLTLDSANGLI